MYKKNIRVLMIEPPNQAALKEKARPNGNLGPAYIMGALKEHGVEVDYLDCTVGREGDDLNKTFYNREELENGNIRYGIDSKELYSIFADYDIIATSSIFTIQTRMHFEIARIAKKVSKDSGKKILVVSGGVNARALREHFLSNGFDIIALGEGERTIVQIVEEFSSGKPDYTKVERIAFRDGDKTITTKAPPRKGTKFIDHLPSPSVEDMPLQTYSDLGIPHWGLPVVGKKFSSLQTARGCQDKCTFCHISLEKKERDLVGDIGFLKLFSKERIGKEVDKLVSLGISRIYFEDDNLFFNKKRLFELAPYLQREGLTYSDVNGANLRFLVKKVESHYEVDHDFIEMLAGFGLDELALPFETASKEMMGKYATNKYDPSEMNPFGILKAVKKNGIRSAAGFLIGFRDEPWESIVRTKEFAKLLMDEGLDQVGFGIPVPYPGTLDFEYEMTKTDQKKDFNANLLKYTDNMHNRGKPLFHTSVPGEDLAKAVREFWEELNDKALQNAVNTMHVDEKAKTFQKEKLFNSNSEFLK
jgi:radical SAM superfamily enzyme YgiQ (UPF0313 family)